MINLIIKKIEIKCLKFYKEKNVKFSYQTNICLSCVDRPRRWCSFSFCQMGAEVPLPPRSPMDMFNAACGPESAIRAADAIDCSRNFLNPPYVFLRDYVGIADPNAAIYEFAGHAFNYVMLTHIIFSVVFAVGYCVVAEKFPKITMWQGVMAGILATIAVHGISLPLLGLTPPLWILPWY